MSAWQTLAFTLAGVVVGAFLQAFTRRFEQERLERWELQKDASRILGRAGLSLRAGNPVDYAGRSRQTLETRVAAREAEANEIRPSLSELAVRWPEAADDLFIVERRMGQAPRLLMRVINEASDEGNQESGRIIRDARDAHTEAMAAYDRVVKLLHSTGGGRH
jgi:hypothetical protein